MQMLQAQYINAWILYSSVQTIYPRVGPSRAPVIVKIVSVTKREVILSWEPIPCRYQNGIILLYVVKYDYMMGPESILWQESQVDGKQLAITLSQLRPNTNYSVRIAGATRAGIGVFSSPTTFVTLGGED